MPAVYDHRLTVSVDEIDELGHANNLVYLRWLLDAALAHSAQQGWPTAAYFELGAGWVVREHRIKYLAAAFRDDELIVRTWVSSFSKVTSRRRYEIISADGTRHASAATEWAFVDFDTGRPRRIPADVAAGFIIVEDESGILP